MAYELKPLPYAENALEPHMSAKTLQFHHGKHHKTYVDKLNELVANTPLEKKTLQELVRDLNGQRGARPKKIFNNAGQVWNHEFFWESMTPKGGGQPDGDLAHLIEVSFGGYDAFKDLSDGQWTNGFEVLGLAEDGVGWALDENNKTLISDEMKTRVDEATRKIIAGEIEVHDYMADSSCPVQ